MISVKPKFLLLRPNVLTKVMKLLAVKNLRGRTLLIVAVLVINLVALCVCSNGSAYTPKPLLLASKGVTLGRNVATLLIFVLASPSQKLLFLGACLLVTLR